MKKLTFALPIMLLVGSLAWWMLNKDYSEIDHQTRLLITGGAAVFSGVISYFLLGSDGERVTRSTDENHRKRKK